MLAQRTSVFTEGARKTKRSKFADDESNQDESCDEEHCRWDQVRAEMIDPPAGDRWNRKHDRDDEDAFAICDATTPASSTSESKRI